VRKLSAADVMLLVTVMLWALNFTASKYVLRHGFHPLAYGGIRYGAAALVFGMFTFGRERSLRVARGDWWLIAVCAVVLWINQIGFIYAIKFTTATTVALVFGTLPIFTAIVARAVGVERLSRRFLAAAAVSFAGVALVAVGSGGGISASWKGDALALVGAFTWAIYTVTISPLMERYSPYRISTSVLFFAWILLALTGARQLATQPLDLGWGPWAVLAFALLGPLVLTNVLWFTAIDHVGPSRAALFANLQFFLAAIFAVILLSERITAVQVAGGAAIAAGILLSRRRVPSLDAFVASAPGAEAPGIPIHDRTHPGDLRRADGDLAPGRARSDDRGDGAAAGRL